MRIHSVLAVVGIAFLTSCAGKSPAPKAPAAEPLASWNGGSIDRFHWENWTKINGLTSSDSKEQLRQFNGYLRQNLDGRAAMDAGAKSDSSKSRRWSSIRERILADYIRREFLAVQGGFSDSAIRKWASTQDSATRNLSMDSLRRKGGEALLVQTMNLDSVYKANLEQFKKDSAHTLPYDSVKPRVREIAYRAALDHVSRNFLANVREAYKVQIPTMTPPPVSEDTLKAFWRSNAERWATPAVYHLSALGSKDSAKLAKALSGAKDLASFQKLAGQFPIGTPAAPKGELGRVKHQFSIPYGIGMVPGLFTELENLKTGKATQVIRANDSLFIAAWLEARDSAGTRPFAAVRAEVQSTYESVHPWQPAPATVVASWDKGPLFTKANIDFISEEIPPQMKRQFPPERVLDFMVSWSVSARKAQEVGLTERPEVKALLGDNESAYWAQDYRNSMDRQLFLFPRKSADSALAAFQKSLVKPMQPDTFGANRDGARILLLRADDMKTAYATGIDAYRQDTIFQPYDSVAGQVFVHLRPVLDERGQARADSIVDARYNLKLSAQAPKAPAKLPAKIALDSARAKHDRRAIDEAEPLYRQVEQDASAPDSLRAQALFQLGQMQGESQNYPKSLEAYRSVLLRFPKSNEAYKAQFMVAFTYSEYLKVEKVAVAEYRKVLANYPKCDLANDADWMIRNILSGGALMPKFDDSAFVADSIARADSLKKVGKAKADTAKAAPVAKPVPAAKDTAKAVKPVAAKVDTAKVAAKAAPVVKPAPVAAKTDTAKVKPAAKDTAKAGKPVVSKAKADTAKAAGTK